MSSFSKLRIRIGKHTKDKLADLLGADMAIDWTGIDRTKKVLTVEKPDEEFLTAAMTGCILGHQGHILGWKNLLSEDGVRFFMPEDSYYLAKLESLENALLRTKFDNFPNVINQWMSLGKNTTFANRLLVEVFQGDNTSKISLPKEIDVFLVWEFKSRLSVPRNAIRRLSTALVDQDIEFHHLAPASQFGGLYIYKNGTSFEIVHEDYYHPGLDIAIHRGITVQEIEYFTRPVENWLLNKEDDDNQQIFDETYRCDVEGFGKSMVELIDCLQVYHSRYDKNGNADEFLKGMSAPGALRLALLSLCFVDNIETCNKDTRGVINRAFSIVEDHHPVFDRNVLLMFINEVMPDDYTIGDIMDMVQRTVGTEVGVVGHNIEVDIADILVN